jgi:hypothetical protein
MKRRLVMLLLTMLVLSGLAVAACQEEKEAATPTPTASPQAQASPATTPTLSPTPVTEPPEFPSFRAFAEEIDHALHERDTQFFVDRAVITERECTGDEQMGMCVDQPAGMTFRGVLSSGAHSGYVRILSLDDYQEHLSHDFDAAAPLRTDELAGGAIVLYGLASSSVDGRPPSIVPAEQRGFCAITSWIMAVDGEHRREVRAFVFTSEDGDWRFRGELLVRFSPEHRAMETYRAWLSGGSTWYYDYWERWTGGAP